MTIAIPIHSPQHSLTMASSRHHHTFSTGASLSLKETVPLGASVHVCACICLRWGHEEVLIRCKVGCRVVGPFLIGRLADATGGSYALPMAALAVMDVLAAALLIGGSHDIGCR